MKTIITNQQGFTKLKHRYPKHTPKYSGIVTKTRQVWSLKKGREIIKVIVHDAL